MATTQSSPQLPVLATLPNSWETDATADDTFGIDGESPFEDPTVEPNAESIDICADPVSGNDPLLLEHQRWSLAVETALVVLRKKQASLTRELQKAESVADLQHRANQLKTNWHMFAGGVSMATIPNWETGETETIHLDPAYDTVGAEIDGIYSRVKRLKRGQQAATTLLEQTSAVLNTLLEMELELASTKTAPPNSSAWIDVGRLRNAQARLVQSSRQTKFVAPREPQLVDHQSHGSNKPSSLPSKGKPKLGTPASHVRKVQSAAGCTILVGRNRRGNEYLSVGGVARDTDIWMHARGSPGAHVLVVQRRSSSEHPMATADCWQLAANLAAFYSDARTERTVPVVAAEPKHVLKPRGAPLGAVKVREEWRVLTGRPDDVPADLKEARSESGQSDEYRQKNKSKLRKQNKQQATNRKQAAKQKATAQREKKHDVESFY
jgi:predicted ribosome quality control (RQC) complex YloA/Tae2 family protein